MAHYHVIVKNRGETIATHTVQAETGLAACNHVEALYGEPVRVEYVTVELDTGQKRNKMIVHNWHGYSFLARKVPADDTN